MLPEEPSALASISRRARHGFIAGAVAGAFSGLPSTVWTFAQGGNASASTVAVGRVAFPHSSSRSRLFASGAIVHLGISLFWGATLALLLPRRHILRNSTIAGVGIAVVDLGVLAPVVDKVRGSQIAALDTTVQTLDHLAFGWTVGVLLDRFAKKSGQ